VKILWVNSNFMHPTTKGGQIRTLEMLRFLHRWHEIHYVAIENPAYPEGPRRSGEYSTRAYPFQFHVPEKPSLGFYRQLAAGMFSSMPLAVSRFYPPGLRPFLENLIRRERFDCAVVDHLAPTSYFPRLEQAVFFQHNVETVIWRRHVEHASGLRRRLFRLQADRMFEYERRVSRAAGHIVAVSAVDAAEMRSLFGVDRISEVPTGVDTAYFARPVAPPAAADLVFIGSMDWLPNIDAMLYFVREILPLIRRSRPDCTLAIVGRTPAAEIAELAKRDPKIQVTGTVPDIRPYLWGSAVSIVPLRIGGGTRLKVYEAMAAGIPVVSTTIGAEGLITSPPDNIRLADTPESFAAECLELLGDASERERLSAAALEMVSARFSWEAVSRCFEKILLAGPRLN
jgi:glycosyltransferase involved in cell wall biosynthesis